MQPPTTIIILAAGLGTRMKSKKAKVLHRAGGKALIEHVVETALNLTAPERVHIVIGHQAEQVRDLVAGRGVGFVVQAQQHGTGHAVLACREAAAAQDGLVVVLYGDTPLLSAATLRRLVEAQAASAAAATAITTMLDDPAGYGRIVRNTEGRMIAVVEEKAATPEQRKIREINAGIYCFRAALLWKTLAEVRPHPASGEFYLTDVVELLVAEGYCVDTLLLNDSSELIGINNRIELAQVDSILRERKIRQLMLDGVTIEKPETVSIDDGVRIGADTIIEPFARILGRTTIGEDCRIGACSIVMDSELADGAEVGPFTIVNTSRLETRARVGPFSRLRMENHLEPGAVVGNFVELKKTRLGAGSKAQHLAYLGDSTIGGKVNVGAGTITCNYDGAAKHPTAIGDGAFIGSNSTLVAPIEIGPGAYVAAGSVITGPVPEDALAVGRGRQVNKEGWAKKRRLAKSGL